MNRKANIAWALLAAPVVVGAQSLPAPPTSPAPVASYEYDAQGNPTRSVLAPGVSGFGLATQHTYDTLDRRTTTTDAKSGVVQIGYEANDQTQQVTDPRGLITQYPRDGFGQPTSIVSPDTGTANQTYDAAGNLLSRTDSRGATTAFVYDALNRLTSAAHSLTGQPGQSFSWIYDQTGSGYSNGVGRLTSSAHPAGSGQYAYDPLGRLTTQVQRVSAATGANASQVTSTVTYAYDLAGNISSVVYPSGRKLSATYTNGQLSALALAKDALSTPVALLSSIAWEPFGQAQSWQWNMASGTMGYSRSYDLYGRLVRYPLGGYVRDLTFDAANRITAFTHYDAATATALPVLDQAFSYDELGRLTGISAGSASWSVGYDANGNRTSHTLNGNTTGYSTSATSNRLLAQSNPARSFSHDNAGNTVSDNGVGYSATYDASGRLASLTKGGATATYHYDGSGRRVRKFTSSGASSTTIFVYDQQGQLLGEYDQSGVALREYVWLRNTPVAMFTPDPANATNPPLVYYIYNDHLDTPRVVISTGNNLRWRWMAEPFGTTAPETNPGGLGVFTQNLRFPGQYADAESGLSYNYFRDYDATTGRYAQSDPIGLAGGINTYTYVGGNPLNYTDPNGLNPVAGAWAGAGAGSAFGPVGTVVGGVIGAGVGAWIGWNVVGPMLAKPPENAYDPNGPKAPGKPGEAEGFKDPKGGENWVRNPNGRGYGWQGADGGVWCPTGPDSGSTGDAHGGPHWDVQYPGGRYDNIYPGGRRR